MAWYRPPQAPRLCASRSASFRATRPRRSGCSLCAVLCYWTCRQICESGGTGRIVRAVALIGLVASVAAIVQRAAEQGAPLRGLAAARCRRPPVRPVRQPQSLRHLGHHGVAAGIRVSARAGARSTAAASFSQRLAAALKQLGSIRIWLVAAICLMTLAVLISTSRSGIIGLMGSLTASAWLSRNRRGSGVLPMDDLSGGAAGTRRDLVRELRRAGCAVRRDRSSRHPQAGDGRAIWADAGRVIRDFAITGTGAGTFGTAIAVYQTAEPGYSIGHAHNHYLQVAAEGGALACGAGGAGGRGVSCAVPPQAEGRRRS